MTYDDVIHDAARKTVAFEHDVRSNLRHSNAGFVRQFSAPPNNDVTDDVFNARNGRKSHDNATTAAAMHTRRSRSFVALDDVTPRETRPQGFTTPQPKIIKYCSQV